MEKENVKPTKSTAKKVLNIVGNVLIWAFVAFAVLMTIFAISSRSNVDNVPSIGGKIISPVRTNSMKPTFKAGDLLISNKIKTTEEQFSLEVGDVITFRTRDLDGDGKRDLNSHRIIVVNLNTDGTVRSYDVKGDNDPGVETVSPVDVVAVWRGTKINGIGNFIFFIQSFLGFGLLIVLPLVLFFILELVLFIKKYLEIKNEGKKKITVEDEEMIKQRAIEEYLRQQQAAKAEAPVEEPKEEAKEPENAPSEDALEEVVEEEDR